MKTYYLKTQVINPILNYTTMKKITYLLLGIVFAFVATSCNDDDPDINVMPKEDVITPSTLSTPDNATYILSEETPDDVVATFSWTAATGEYNGNITYYLVASKAGEDFNFVDAVILDASTADLTIDVTHVQINKPLIDLGITSGEATDVELRVMAVLNLDKNFAFSEPITVTVTPYAMETGDVELAPLYMVGGYDVAGSWTPADAGEMNAVDTDEDGVVDFYEACLYMDVDNGIKFIGGLNWDNGNYGLNGGVDDGSLLDSGESSDLKVPENGFYYIWVDIANMSYKYVKMEWGVIGDLNGWGAQEPLTYDIATNNFSGPIILGDGERGFKLRSGNTGLAIADDEWAYNVGPNSIEAAQIRDIAEAPNYDFDAGTYTVTLGIDFKGVPTVTFE